MKRTFLKVSAVAGVASLAMLAAGPAMAATTVSQANAQGIDLQLAGNRLITGKTVATNDGKTQAKSTENTLPGVAGLVPGTNIAGLGVVLQDAYAKSSGYSTACAGLTGQGGGLVQVGDQECSIDGGNAISLSLANFDLGGLIANPNTVVGQIVGALGPLNGLAGTLQSALLAPVTKALSDNLGNVGLSGSLGVVAATCEATPTSADGYVTVANGHLDLTLGKQVLRLVDLPAGDKDTNPIPPNTHVLTDLSKVTDVVLKAVTTAVTNLLSSPLSSIPQDGSPLGTLAAALAPVAGLTAQLGSALGLVTSTLQTQVLTAVTNALQPLLKPLQDNVLDITLNKQSLPQANKTFAATALDLQLLPAAKQFTGSSLVGGVIGNVSCGPNNKVVVPTEPPAPTKTPTKTPNVPTGIDSGSNGSNTGTIIAAMSVLLAAGGAAGAGAYRRYWMPRG